MWGTKAIKSTKWPAEWVLVLQWQSLIAKNNQQHHLQYYNSTESAIMTRDALGVGHRKWWESLCTKQNNLKPSCFVWCRVILITGPSVPHVVVLSWLLTLYCHSTVVVLLAGYFWLSNFTSAVPVPTLLVILLTWLVVDTKLAYFILKVPSRIYFFNPWLFLVSSSIGSPLSPYSWTSVNSRYVVSYFNFISNIFIIYCCFNWLKLWNLSFVRVCAIFFYIVTLETPNSTFNTSDQYP